MNFKIEKFLTDEKLRTILISNNSNTIYTGGSSGCLVDRTNNKVLHKHDKSITSIKSYGEFMGCSSYDCTASIFFKNELMDVIEGPDTEIKGLAFSEGFIALSTRGKNVWVCKLGKYIEIDKILEDHSEDVKGCRFYNDYLFTYGYDTTIKIYGFFEYSGGYELVQDICTGHTVWDILFIEEDTLSSSLFVASDSGEIIKYNLEKGWVEVSRKQLGISPIYTLCMYKNTIVTGINGGNLVFLDLNLNVLKIIEGLHSGDINCISYSKGLLGTCSDDQTYCLLRDEE